MPAEDVEYHPSRDTAGGRRLFRLLLIAGCCTVVAAAASFVPRNFPLWLSSGWAAVGLLQVVAILVMRGAYLKVDGDGITWRGWLRRQSVPWDQIERLELRTGTTPALPRFDLWIFVRDGERLRPSQDAVSYLEQDDQAVWRERITGCLGARAAAAGVPFEQTSGYTLV